MADPLIEMTTDIVSNYVAGNKIGAADLPTLIQSIFKALSNVGVEAPPPPSAVPKPTPAQIRRSIKPDGLVSFEDGKTYKTLKRHLTTKGLTIAAYKAKWGLPSDYPTTAPNYSAARSEFAKARGLGARKSPPAPAPRGRSKKGG